MALQSTSKMSIDSILNPEPPSNQPKLANTYWPVLRDALLQDPSSYNNLHLDCGICLDKMTIFQHEHTFQNDHAHGTFSHRARILPCGHIFGSSCVISLLTNLIESDQPIVCPVCRMNLPSHKGCSHVHFGMPMPTSISEIRTFPGTITEGGRVAEKCRDCQVMDALVGIKCMASILLPPVDDGVICVRAKTTGRWWDTKLEEFDVVEDISIRGPLLKVCQVVEMTLKANAVRSWGSGDLRGLEIAVRVCREQRIEFVEVGRGYQSAWDPRPIYEMQL
ncbi:hypothetical protein NW768_000884 [Fusarium equiseti]|uniref:RING-type domain-containing protein n=1 Tax=Fusarium equiseti TaxID=61235 RepID=A0ABQ8RU92_FUSEQ|nr:hypothetical protein NW768_000884 [Fusarium equiseti]